MAFNGKYAYKWPQQGGRKGRNNQSRNKNRNQNKNKNVSDGDVRDRTDADSSTVSHSSRLSQFKQPPKGTGRQRGSRKRQTTGGDSNEGGGDKKKVKII